jgi:hypothetical protein
MQEELLTTLIQKSGDALAKLTTELGDKANWKPLDKGRSACDQCVECGLLSTFIAASLNTQGPPPFDRDRLNALKAECDTAEKALAVLSEGTQALLSAITSFPADKWDVKQTLPWGEFSFFDLGMFVYWNNTYHEGQISFIQTLAGE